MKLSGQIQSESPGADKSQDNLVKGHFWTKIDFFDNFSFSFSKNEGQGFESSHQELSESARKFEKGQKLKKLSEVKVL